MEDLEQGWHYDLPEVYGIADTAALSRLDGSPAVFHEGYLAKASF